MPTYRLVAIIPSVSGLPRDASQNAFYFTTPSAMTTGNMDALAGVLSTFYSHHPASHGTGLNDYFAADRDETTGAFEIATYLMPSTPGPTGPPVRRLFTDWQAPSSPHQPLPDQVAVCMSYKAALGSSVLVNRFRGRIFLGPLNVLSMEESSTGGGPQTPSATFMDVILGDATEILQTAVEALSFSPRWSMWSQTDWVARPIIQASVDDRFDTQRRRLERAGTRLTVPIT